MSHHEPFTKEKGTIRTVTEAILNPSDTHGKTPLTSELNEVLRADTWTPEEEKKLVRRLDLYLIPLVMCMFFTLNLDRYLSPLTCLQKRY